MYLLFCLKSQAKNPVREDLIKALGVQQLHLTCGAVCVYPSRVPEAIKCLKQCGGSHIPVASGNAYALMYLIRS